MEHSGLSNFIFVPAGEALLRTAEPAVHTGPGVQGDQPADGPHLCVCPHPRQVSPQSPLPPPSNPVCSPVSLIYFAEKGSQQQWSFYDSFWWGLMCITTVGSGELAPKTLVGKVGQDSTGTLWCTACCRWWEASRPSWASSSWRCPSL